MDNATIDLQHAFYDMLMQSQYWSPERMRDYQRSQLTQLLRHAKKNVPFYENRLDAVMLPNGDIDWNRWSEIPIVKRSDLIEHREAMQARELPPGHAILGTIQSSGSTGEPVEVIVTNLSHMGSEAARYRAAEWHGLDFSNDLCRRRGSEADVVPPDGVEEGPWGALWSSAPLGRSFRMTRDWQVSDQLDFILKVGAPYLAIGNPKVAHSIAQHARALDIHVDIPVILVSGERAGQEERTACRDVFGAEIIELYSSKEGAHMAHLCPSRSGFHVNAERILVEIVGKDGRAVENGEAGRVVITPFYSTAQPLVRYDHGDVATWGTACGCGRSLPYIASIDGRESHMFRHPDGRRIHRGISEQYREALGATFWQFAQVGPLEFEVRYVPRQAEVAGDEAAVGAAFRRYYFDDAKIVFRRVEAIPLTAAGKFMEFVYEVTDRS